MIIFDLDGTLADCEHRRHFIDPSKRDDCILWMSNTTKEEWIYRDGWHNPETRKKFKPDWQAFYDPCDKDELIFSVAEIYDQLWTQSDGYERFEIWSGRCNSVRKKTEKWLRKNDINYSALKMRPIRDNTPDEVLKERWLDDHIASGGKPIEFVFDSHNASVAMYHRRGIFVFNCAQHDEEF